MKTARIAVVTMLALGTLAMFDAWHRVNDPAWVSSRLVEAADERGVTVTIDEVEFVDPLAGALHLRGVSALARGTEATLSADEVSLRLDPWAALRGEVVINDLRLVAPTLRLYLAVASLRSRAEHGSRDRDLRVGRLRVARRPDRPRPSPRNPRMA